MEKDELKAIIPADHPLAKKNVFPLEELAKEPFMLLEKGARAEVSELFERNGLQWCIFSCKIIKWICDM